MFAALNDLRRGDKTQSRRFAWTSSGRTSFAVAQLLNNGRLLAVLSQRYRPLTLGTLLILAGWFVAFAGHQVATNARVTADKVAAQLRTTDLARLSPDKRAKTLQSLAGQVNSLTGEERRRARVDREWGRIFNQMTDQEKGSFIDATMPPGFRQMLGAFQQLPEAVRQRAARDALRRIQETAVGSGMSGQGTNSAVGLSPELQQRVLESDVNSYFDESSEQVKYELLLVLEEAQRLMESGRLFRGGPRR
jgi:hypothetical protein